MRAHIRVDKSLVAFLNLCYVGFLSCRCTGYSGYHALKSDGDRPFRQAVLHALATHEGGIRTLYSSYSLVWNTCDDSNAKVEFGGTVFRSKFCLWGNMLPHKIATVLSLLHQQNVTVLIESGRKGGMSAFTYSQAVPTVVSVELNPINEVMETLSVVARNVRLVNGNGENLVPVVVQEYVEKGERVAVILDGPKGAKAAALVPRLSSKVVFVALDDIAESSRPWRSIRREANDEVYSTSERQHLLRYLPRDEKWAATVLHRTKSKQLLSIFHMASNISLTRDYHRKSGLVFVPGAKFQHPDYQGFEAVELN